jgi:hypothetical protein
MTAVPDMQKTKGLQCRGRSADDLAAMSIDLGDGWPWRP